MPCFIFRWSPSVTMQIIKSYLHWAALALEGKVKVFQVKNTIFRVSSIEKSHTCEEGGTHPRISVWHLLMNLKNNYSFKKLLKRANKKCECFNIYKNKKIIIIKNKEKHLEIPLFYTCLPTIFIWSTVLEI